MRRSANTPTIDLAAGTALWRHAICGMVMLLAMAASAIAQTQDASIIE